MDIHKYTPRPVLRPRPWEIPSLIDILVRIHNSNFIRNFVVSKVLICRKNGIYGNIYRVLSL